MQLEASSLSEQRLRQTLEKERTHAMMQTEDATRKLKRLETDLQLSQVCIFHSIIY